MRNSDNSPRKAIRNLLIRQLNIVFRNKFCNNHLAHIRHIKPRRTSLFHRAPERKSPAWVRESGFWFLTFSRRGIFYKTEAVEFVRLGIVIDVFHHGLLGNDDPVVGGDVGSVAECEGRHYFAGHANFEVLVCYRLRRKQNWQDIQIVTGFKRAVSFRKESRSGHSLLARLKCMPPDFLSSSRKGSRYSGWRQRL